MTAIDRIKENARLCGITVRPEFLRDDGSVDQRGLDIPIYDFLLNEKAFAYIGSGAERVHAHRIASIVPDGDEFIIEVHDGLRIVVSLVVWPDQKIAYDLARAQRSENLVEEMRSLFDAFQR